MNRALLAILFLFLPASCLADDLFDIKPVADGIYAAIAKPAYKVNCNAAIIFLDDVVLVVIRVVGRCCRCSSRRGHVGAAAGGTWRRAVACLLLKHATSVPRSPRCCV